MVDRVGCAGHSARTSRAHGCGDRVRVQRVVSSDACARCDVIECAGICPVARAAPTTEGVSRSWALRAGAAAAMRNRVRRAGHAASAAWAHAGRDGVGVEREACADGTVSVDAARGVGVAAQCATATGDAGDAVATVGGYRKARRGARDDGDHGTGGQAAASAGVWRHVERVDHADQLRFTRQRVDVERKGVSTPALEEFRWMIEELRVSLFAQELKTPYPISIKRLQKLWDSVHA